MLPEESREILAKLLPSAAFLGFQGATEPHHPSKTYAGHSEPNAMDVDEPATNTTTSQTEVPSVSSALVDLSTFTDPHFLAAARTFQDHLYSGWLTEAHAEKVKKFQTETRLGTLHVPWKDEVWERDHFGTHTRSPR